MTLTVLVTGASGNLGKKTIEHLLGASWCGRIVALSQTGGLHIPGGERKLDSVALDLSGDCLVPLASAMSGVDAVVHFAAQNPYPTANWHDSEVSFEMALKVWSAAERAGVRRVVAASSNHVMGGYKERLDVLAAGGLMTDMMPLVGTVTKSPEGIVSSSTAYAAAKLMAERAYLHSAKASNGRVSAVCIRLGWCQPGENLASTISATGLEEASVDTGDPDVQRAHLWFRGMWLSNRDFCHLMERAILADSAVWPEPGIIVNGMSANRDMVWNIDTARSLLQYAPQDDVSRG